MSLAAAGQTQTPARSATASCVSCRRRKVRCSRTIPCSNCAKANTHCDYSLAGRKGRPKADANGPRYDKTAQSRLLEKVRRLEEIVEHLNGQVDATTPESPAYTRFSSSGDGVHADKPTRLGISTLDLEQPKKHASYEESGLLVSSDRGKFYVSGDFWSTLRKEVRQVRESFENEGEGNTAESDDLEDATDSPNSGTSFIFREANAFDRTLTDAMFPLPSQMHFIWQTFVERINPLLNVLHVPTITRVLEGCKGQLKTLCPDMQSLFACISFAAVQSLSDEEVLLDFAVDKTSLLSRYRRGAEQSLSNADVIKTTNLAPVQALVIYLSVLQSDEPFRHVWTLIGILVRVALSLGLHRDGKFFKNISPFDAEMRRRLWWNVAILDARMGDTQEPIATITQDMFTTEIPSNVNDTDIYPDMTEPPIPRSGPTDMSVHLVRCKLWRFGRVLQSLSLATPSTKDGTDWRKTYERKLEVTRKFKKDIAEEFGSSLEDYSGAAAFINAITDTLTDRIELIAHYQFSLVEKQGPSFPHEAFQIASGILERFLCIENSPDMTRWRWAAKGSVSWQPMGIILSHLCGTPWDEESEKAWQLIDLAFKNMVKAVTKEPLWKPFQRLFLRAQRCREKYLQAQKTGGNMAQGGQWSGLVSRKNDNTADSICFMPAKIQGILRGGNSTDTYRNEQGADSVFTTGRPSPPYSFQATNEKTGTGVVSQPIKDNEFDMGIDIGPMDLNDWEDCLNRGFWSFSGI